MNGLPDTPENCQIQRLTRDALHQIGRQNLAPSASHNSRTPARQQDNQEADQDARTRGCTGLDIKTKVITLALQKVVTAIAATLAMHEISSMSGVTDAPQTRPIVFHPSART